MKEEGQSDEEGIRRRRNGKVENKKIKKRKNLEKK